jgi:hypothetical protein
MAVHIEGMGWLGSVLAYRLRAEGVEFTWNDTEDKLNSWEASTGLVYPAGDERSQKNLTEWNRWYLRPFLPERSVERVNYLFAHKSPPHGGKWGFHDLGPAKLADDHAFSVNVPAIVHQARREFAARRTDSVPAGALLFRAHGTQRAEKYMWGWSAPVRLVLPPALADLEHRPVFYGRQVRRLVYAYALPGTDLHLAGSTLVRQSTRKPLNVEKHVARWCADWVVTFPEIGLMDIGKPVQGWRPRPAEDDHADVVRTGDSVSLPALWHSGVRWAPGVIDKAIEQL